MQNQPNALYIRDVIPECYISSFLHYMSQLICSIKLRTIDYDQAKEDVKPFIKNTEPIELWNADFFTSITHQYLFR